MKILSAQQIREWDQYTIQHEPIQSIDLMERAASKCMAWLDENGYAGRRFSIFCGKGNNGGDGLAIARMLAERDIGVAVYILEFGHKGTEDFQVNLARLHLHPSVVIRFIQGEAHFPSLSGDEVIIDAILGSGINRPVEGLTAALISYMNNTGCQIIAIDIPSGLFSDHSSVGNLAVTATHTLSFQCFKPAFLVAENAAAAGEVHILDIGLHKDYYDMLTGTPELTDERLIRKIYKPKNRFAHKGSFGHALLIAGSFGKMGAAVLAAKGYLRSGAGLLTCHVPGCGYNILQSTAPEAMVVADKHDLYITGLEADLSSYKAIGTGPGIGTAPETRGAIEVLLKKYQGPVIIDADALNIIAGDNGLLKLLSPGTVLTPHPKEFDRLFGASSNDFERIEKAVTNAAALNVIIILKGHYTVIAMPDGKCYFNSTGNPGMAKGGSGDVLTGILTGLLAQGYPPADAAVLGVYLHGLAGDFAARKLSEEAMTASDITEHLSLAFNAIRGNE